MNLSNFLVLPRILKREFAGYTMATFQRDAMAGISVAAVALPLALAFGISAGATAAAGLVTAILSGLIMGGLSGGPFQISGPEGAMSAVLIIIATRFGLNAMFIVGLLSGLIILAVGIFRLGRVVGLIPRPVITGFTSGIAIIILVGQIDNLLGAPTPVASSSIQKLFGYLRGGFTVNWQTLLCGGIVLAAMFLLPKRISRVVPGSLIGLVLATALSRILNFNVPVIGDIPRAILLNDRLTLSLDLLPSVPDLIVPAFSIAALGSIQSLLCGAVCARATGRKIDNDQELVAQGIGNILIPFFGGVPSTAAVARSVVGVASGGQTRMVSIIHGLLLLACVLVFGPVIAIVPHAALAGVLVATAIRMNEWTEIRWMIGHRFKSSILAFAATMLATAWLDLTEAILIGMALSALIFVWRASDVEVERREVSLEAMQKQGHAIERIHDSMSVIYITGPMFFAAASPLRAAFEEHPEDRVLILSMRGVPLIDVSGLEVIEELIDKQSARKGLLMLAAVQPAVREMLDRARLTERIGADNIFWSADKAILAANLRLMPAA
ncbi:MAG TPA: SulP family inorganic anion transporter [Thermoflexales bacterium]|nr:SulP family inorganic anion transporter [Thermoflexales bacterium]HQZ54035.1 SulP family inorganic anion transporter [Thermoflexales bacterium]